MSWFNNKEDELRKEKLRKKGDAKQLRFIKKFPVGSEITYLGQKMVITENFGVRSTPVFFGTYSRLLCEYMRDGELKKVSINSELAHTLKEKK